jgi:hypothetical protein
LSHNPVVYRQFSLAGRRRFEAGRPLSERLKYNRIQRLGALGGPFRHDNPINARGSIVGSFRDRNDVDRAYLFEDGRYETITFPGARLSTVGRAISNCGDIVGSWDDTGGREHGYLRARDGTLMSFDVPSAALTRAQGVNCRGDIVGRFDEPGELPPRGHGRLGRHDGDSFIFRSLDVPVQGPTTTAAQGINERGDIRRVVQHWFGAARIPAGSRNTRNESLTQSSGKGLVSNGRRALDRAGRTVLWVSDEPLPA